LRLVARILATVLIGGPASAQGWQEYSNPDLGFALHFPNDPRIEGTIYMTADGTTVPARIYSLNQQTSAYRMIVADFSRRTNLSDRQEIDLAIKTLAQEAAVKLEIPARVNRVVSLASSARMPAGRASLCSKPNIASIRSKEPFFLRTRFLVGRGDSVSAIAALHQ
jgi:hypothetical protein